MTSLNGQITMNKLLAILIFPFCIHANEIIFDQIKEVKQRLERMEKMIIGGAFGIVVALLLNMLK